MVSRQTLLRATSMVGLLFSTNALAVEPQDNKPGEISELSEGGNEGEIIVTARKRQERAQDIPVAVTVQNSELLQQRSVTQFTELSRATPSLIINNSLYSPATTNIAMRGQALVDIRLYIDPAVGIYQDGVYLPRAQGSTASNLFDVDRVEVLAGPQGTLYGKNTTGGLLSIISKEPKNVVEAEFRARYGSFNEVALDGMINVPLQPNLALRVVGSYKYRDGIGKNLTTGNDLGWIDSVGVRGALKWTPTDRLTVLLRGDYSDNKAGGMAFHGFQTLRTPTTPVTCAIPAACGSPAAVYEAALELNGLNTTSFSAQSQAVRQAQLDAARLALLGTLADGNDAALNLDPFDNIKVWGYSATIDWEVADDISLRSISAMRGFRRVGATDLDGTPFEIFAFLEHSARDKQFSQELQLSGKAFEGRMDWIVGGYYSDEDGYETGHQRAVPLIVNSGPSNPLADLIQTAPVENKSKGAFAQVTYKLIDNLSVTGGIRYSWDKRFVSPSISNTNAAGLGTCASLALPIVASVTPGGLGLTSVDQCVRPMHASFHKASYTLSVDYKVTPDIMLYAKTSRGYRSGGLQMNAGVNPAADCNTPTGASPGSACLANITLVNTSFKPFRPETVTDYEFGIKSQFFDRRLTVNLTYFRSKLDDAIRSVAITVVGSAAIATRAQNAASVKIDGIEWQVSAYPSPWLELYSSGAYLDGRYGSYVTPTGENRTSLPVLFTPKFQYNLGGAVTLPVGFGKWRSSVDWQHTSRMLAAEVLAYTEPHGELNARTSLSVDSAGLDVALFVKNLTKKRYFNYRSDVSSLGGNLNHAISLPRRFGIEISKRF